MKNRKKHLIYNLISNLLIVAMAIFSQLQLIVFNITNISNPLSLYSYFTICINQFVGAVAVIAIIFNIIILVTKKDKTPFWFTILYYAATCAITMTLITVSCWLIYEDGINELFDYSNMNIFVHLLVPFMALVNFAFFYNKNKIKFAFTFVGILPVLTYGVTYLIMVFGQKAWPDYYHLGFNNMVWLTSIIFISIAYAICVLIWYINKRLHHHIYEKKYD